MRVEALAGNFESAEWIQVWDADFDVEIFDTSAKFVSPSPDPLDSPGLQQCEPIVREICK